MKRYVLALVFVFCCSVFVSATSEAAQFNDVKKNSPYYEAVTALSNEGIINGKKPGYFKPKDTLTRAQASKMIALSLDMMANSNDVSFKDVKASSEYAKYIAALSSQGFINGYSDGKFKPNNKLNKRQLAKIIANAYHLDNAASNNTILPFKDIKKNSEEEQYVKMLYKAGVVAKASKFNGNKQVTRGEFAQMVYLAQKASIAHEDVEFYDSDEDYVYTSIGALKYSDKIEVERLQDTFSLKIRRGEIVAITDGYAEKVLLANNKITVTSKQGVAKGEFAVNYADLDVDGIVMMEVHPADTDKVVVEHELQKSYNYCDFSSPLEHTTLSTGDYYTLMKDTSPVDHLATGDYSNSVNTTVSTNDYTKLSTGDYSNRLDTKLSTFDYYTGNVNTPKYATTSLTTKDIWSLKNDTIGISTKDYTSAGNGITTGFATADYLDKVSIDHTGVSTNDFTTGLSTDDYYNGQSDCTNINITPYGNYIVTGLQANTVARVLVTANTNASIMTPQYEQFEIYVKVDRHKKISLFFK